MELQRVQDIVRNGERDELKIEDPNEYYALVGLDDWRIVNSVALMNIIRDEHGRDRGEDFPYMGVRLSSGMIGELDCPAVNKKYVPKGKDEVILGLGYAGIAGLLDMGALPCMTCKSGERLQKLCDPQIQETLQSAVGDTQNATDPKWLTSNYDSRRLEWLMLATDFRISPSRFYTRPGLSETETYLIADNFQHAGLAIPAIGYFDPTNTETYFTTYDI